MKYYDKKNDRLVYCLEKSDKKFWQHHWKDQDFRFAQSNRVPWNNFVINKTKKYLPRRSIVLEGGAGIAEQSWYLKSAGFRTISLDYILDLPEGLKKIGPYVRYIIGDARNIPLPDNSVDGYWSLGVIEHWYDGYDHFRNEMKRVIKPGGYLFISFPWLNTLRKIKTFFKEYPFYNHTENNRDNFYQFALNENKVLKDFQETKFSFVEHYSYAGLKGLREDLPRLREVINKLIKMRNRPGKILTRVLNQLLCPLSGHMRLLILKKS